MLNNIQNMMLDPELLAKLDEDQLLHLPLYFFIKNETGIYISCNDFMAQVLGFNKGVEILGCTDFDLSWTESAPLFRGNDNQVIRAEKPKTFIETGRLAHGENSSAFSYKWPLRLQSKKIVGIMCISIPVEKDTSLNKNSIDIIACEYDITKRQKECLHYLVRGMTIKEIGSILGLSPRTVEHYIEALKIKLDCNSRSQLIAKVLER
jgi:DNA-binding CsgD family transcriptional regulator